MSGAIALPDRTDDLVNWDQATFTGTGYAAVWNGTKFVGADYINQVKALPLNQLANPAANLNLAGFKITNAGNPSVSGDVATKAYVDSAVGLVEGTTDLVPGFGIDLDNLTATVSIAASYPGQNTIVTLGTVTTGVWHATAIGPTYGGTGLTAVTAGDLVYGSATNTWSRLAKGTANQVLQMDGSGNFPSWVTLSGGTPGLLVAANPTDIPLIVKGAASQTANLAEYRDNSDVVLSYMDKLGRAYPKTLSFGIALGAPVTVSNDVTNWPIVERVSKCLGVYLVAKTAPTGSDLIFDILKSSDGGSSFTSLWASNPSNRPKIVAGSRTGNQTAFDTSEIAAGDIFRIDVVQIGSSTPGQDITVQLLLICRNN